MLPFLFLHLSLEIEPGRMEWINETGKFFFSFIYLETLFITFLFSLFFKDNLLKFEMGRRTASWTWNGGKLDFFSFLLFRNISNIPFFLFFLGTTS
jgi:hypothetical protein